MISKRAWETYPLDYRTREIKILSDWIRVGESGSIIGLAGAGKPNLLGFLCHRPEAITRHLLKDEARAEGEALFSASSFKLAVVHVDLNNLPNYELATFYRIILRSLYEAGEQLAAIDLFLSQEIEKLYRPIIEKTDPFVTQTALREAIFLLKKMDVRLVLVLDPFDQFCQMATIQILDNLRGLRDGFKSTLSYLVGLRHELAYLRNPEELGELYEILDIHRCWLGPMEADDAGWVIHQVETATHHSFDKKQIAKLIQLTGGYPCLLKAASLWLARTCPKADKTTWQELLLGESSIQNRLQELWNGLTGEEQEGLTVLQKTLGVKAGTATQQKEKTESLRQIADKYQAPLTRLQAKKLCHQDEEGEWQIFSPLWAGFVASQYGISGGKIRQEVETGRFFRGDLELTNLSQKDRHLLRFLVGQRSGAVHSLDDLIEAAWSEDESAGVTNQAVQQAIRHLRKRIEPNPAKPIYLITESKAGYRFFPEGAPRG